ncbi:MAG: PepSY domain-containing protein [Paracoccaceae bacterium]
MKNPILPFVGVIALLAGAAAADTPPPANALPLSQILQGIEAGGDVAWIDEVDWDDDGYWDVEYYTTDGRQVDVKIDPLTGARR